MEFRLIALLWVAAVACGRTEKNPHARRDSTIQSVTGLTPEGPLAGDVPLVTEIICGEWASPAAPARREVR